MAEKMVEDTVADLNAEVQGKKVSNDEIDEDEVTVIQPEPEDLLAKKRKATKALTNLTKQAKRDTKRQKEIAEITKLKKDLYAKLKAVKAQQDVLDLATVKANASDWNLSDEQLRFFEFYYGNNKEFLQMYGKIAFQDNITINTSNTSEDSYISNDSLYLTSITSTPTGHIFYTNFLNDDGKLKVSLSERKEGEHSIETKVFYIFGEVASCMSYTRYSKRNLAGKKKKEYLNRGTFVRNTMDFSPNLMIFLGPGAEFKTIRSQKTVTVANFGEKSPELLKLTCNLSTSEIICTFYYRNNIYLTRTLYSGDTRYFRESVVNNAKNTLLEIVSSSVSNMFTNYLSPYFTSSTDFGYVLNTEKISKLRDLYTDKDLKSSYIDFLSNYDLTKKLVYLDEKAKKLLDKKTITNAVLKIVPKKNVCTTLAFTAGVSLRNVVKQKVGTDVLCELKVITQLPGLIFLLTPDFLMNYWKYVIINDQIETLAQAKSRNNLLPVLKTLVTSRKLFQFYISIFKSFLNFLTEIVVMDLKGSTISKSVKLNEMVTNMLTKLNILRESEGLTSMMIIPLIFYIRAVHIDLTETYKVKDLKLNEIGLYNFTNLPIDTLINTLTAYNKVLAVRSDTLFEQLKKIYRRFYLDFSNGIDSYPGPMVRTEAEFNEVLSNIDKFFTSNIDSLNVNANSFVNSMKNSIRSEISNLEGQKSVYLAMGTKKDKDGSIIMPPKLTVIEQKIDLLKSDLDKLDNIAVGDNSNYVAEEVMARLSFVGINSCLASSNLTTSEKNLLASNFSDEKVVDTQKEIKEKLNDLGDVNSIKDNLLEAELKDLGFEAQKTKEEVAKIKSGFRKKFVKKKGISKNTTVNSTINN